MGCSLYIRLPLLACLSFFFLTRQSGTCVKEGKAVPCAPGQDHCAEPFKDAPIFHLMSQHGCGENDPNGPVFDPVHGVIHQFYQDHLFYGTGHGPIYGHFVSKDFLHWAEMPVAIWNGLDSSVDPPRETFYDTQAIFTGSAVVVDGAGPKNTPGVVQIYPGLCDASYPKCGTGTVLAQAVPADYAGDQLLTNWTKPLYNPIMENTQRDPSSPWKMPNGEWRLRTYDSQFYGAASDQDLIDGRWYHLGQGDLTSWPTCECPSFFPLPGPTPGFEKEYNAAKLPSHVQKLSCGISVEQWMLGTYVPGKGNGTRSIGNFTATKGWEELFPKHSIDNGPFYASKDNVYPTKDGLERRILWGWSIVKPSSTQSLPRVLTFNAAARRLEQAPLPELVDLRKESLAEAMHVKVSNFDPLRFRLPLRGALYSETIVRFALPKKNATLRTGFFPSRSFAFMDSTYLKGEYDERRVENVHDCQKACDQEWNCTAWSFVGKDSCHLKATVELKSESKDAVSGIKPAENLSCAVEYVPMKGKFADLAVQCGSASGRVGDVLRLLESEDHLEIRIFADATFLEVFFQNGRTVMTVPYAPPMTSELLVLADVDTEVNISSYSMKSIWVSEDFVRKQPRVYPTARVSQI